MGQPAPPDPSSLVVITNSQMFSELRALTRATDQATQKIDTIGRTLEATTGDVEKRLRALEARRWPLPVLCVILSAGSFIATLVTLTQRH